MSVFIRFDVYTSLTQSGRRCFYVLALENIGVFKGCVMVAFMQEQLQSLCDNHHQTFWLYESRKYRPRIGGSSWSHVPYIIASMRTVVKNNGTATPSMQLQLLNMHGIRNITV